MNSSPTSWMALLGLSVFGCALGLAAMARADESAERRARDPDPARFDEAIAAFEAYDRKNASPRSPVLFVGSSSIRLWNSAESFPGVPVINRGFGGSHISDVNHFAERIVIKYRPRTIVFYAGDNDIAGGKSPRQVADDFRFFVETVRHALPETRIIYLPIKPSTARWELWPKMQEANTLIEQLAADDERLVCLDTASAMLGADGQPRGELLARDGLHLSAAGYRVWNDLLAPHLSAP